MCDMLEDSLHKCEDLAGGGGLFYIAPESRPRTSDINLGTVRSI